MHVSQSSVSTTRAERYIKQICAHFGHPVRVLKACSHGEINLPFGTCTRTASASELNLSVHGSADNLDRLVRTFTAHLERCAFRENPKIEWHRADSETSERNLR